MTQDSGAFTQAFESRPALSGRFEIISVLGDGAAGFVYRVRDNAQEKREVALKVLANDLAFDEATLDRFMAELKICQRIRHRNLVEAYDLIELGDTVAYTMEYVDGGSLQSLFARQRIGLEAIDKILEQVLDGLQVLHENGIVHRDIKLENVLVRTDGTVKLTDLGLMKQLGQKGLTRPGILLGTPQYMPPEYVRESKYDERGDIYTVGLMLYELLTGKRWLSHLKGQEVISYLLKTKFHISRSSLSGMPRKYLTVLGRALDPRPEHRYQSAGEMKKDLLEIPKAKIESSLEIRGGLTLQTMHEAAAIKKKPGIFAPLWFKLATGLVAGVGLALAFVMFYRR